jgi:hypothetical protein
MRSGTLAMPPEKRHQYVRNGRRMDDGIHFHKSREGWWCWCSGCGKWVKMKQPWDLSCYKTHKIKCLLPSRTHHIEAFEHPTPDLVACIGLTPALDPLIKRYLEHSVTHSGGAPTQNSIAKSEYQGRSFARLCTLEQDCVCHIQRLNQTWRNQHEPTFALFSTSCKEFVNTGGIDMDAVCCACLSLKGSAALQYALRHLGSTKT